MPHALHGRPRVLLAAHTGHKYVVQHYELLERMGCDTYVASYKTAEANLVSGIDFMLCERGPWDLLIHMGLGPDLERAQGFELIAAIRTRYRELPILVVSGHDASYALVETRKAGGSDYLRRDTPHEPAEFEAKVRALLGDKAPPVTHTAPSQ